MNLFALVKAGTTELGTEPVRFFEFGTAPALEQVPYATWQILQGDPYNYLAGAPHSDQIKTQIDVWAATAAEARAVSKAVRRCLDTEGQITFWQQTWDEPSKLYRVILHIEYAQEI